MRSVPEPLSPDRHEARACRPDLGLLTHATATRRSSWGQFLWLTAAPGRPGWVLILSAGLIAIIAAVEWAIPANVVAYGFVLPILLVAITCNRRLMVVMMMICVLATYGGLLRPTKPGRFAAAAINRSVVVAVLIGVAYFAITREERKAREEATCAELARQADDLLKANAELVELKAALSRSERLAALGLLASSVAHEVGTPLHSIAWQV